MLAASPGLEIGSLRASLDHPGEDKPPLSALNYGQTSLPRCHKASPSNVGGEEGPRQHPRDDIFKSRSEKGDFLYTCMSGVFVHQDDG